MIILKKYLTNLVVHMHWFTMLKSICITNQILEKNLMGIEGRDWP